MTASEIGEDDLSLIHALQIGPRLPWTFLGEVLERHPTSLAARWRRLSEEGLAWITAHPLGRPGQMSLSFHDIRCAPGRGGEVLRAVCALPDVITVEECHRDRDLMLTVVAPSETTLTEELYPQLKTIPGLDGFETSFCTRLHSQGGAWRLAALSADQQRALRSATDPAPPRLDRAPASFGPIMRELERDGRASAVQIAEATGLHPATARRRLREVLASGALAIRCEVSHRAVGYSLVCQWFAHLPVDRHDDAAGALESIGALRLCASTTGRTNFTFMMWLHSAAEIMDVERAVGQQVPGLELRESVIIASIPKRVGWELHPDGHRTGRFTPFSDQWDEFR